MTARKRNIVGGIALGAFFVGFTWLIGSSQRRSFDLAMERLAAERGIGPRKGTLYSAHSPGSVAPGMAPAIQLFEVEVDHSTCRYLVPKNAVSYYFNFLMCASCIRQAEALLAQYEITVQEGTCGRRGRNTLFFKVR